MVELPKLLSRGKIERDGDDKPGESFFRPLARQLRAATRLPLILVGGFRSRQVMEAVLSAGEADFISICRPLICEPELPNRLSQGLQDRSACISGNRCRPEQAGKGISCRCPVDRSTPEVML